MGRAVEGPACSQYYNLLMYRKNRNYCVYIVASITRVLYCGVTNDIKRRVSEHRRGAFAGFSAQYNCDRLVWYERYQWVGNAIKREKQIKRWRREKKLFLIVKENPTWVDLSEKWPIV